MHTCFQVAARGEYSAQSLGAFLNKIVRSFIKPDAWAAYTPTVGDLDDKCEDMNKLLTVRPPYEKSANTPGKGSPKSKGEGKAGTKTTEEGGDEAAVTLAPGKSGARNRRYLKCLPAVCRCIAGDDVIGSSWRDPGHILRRCTCWL